MSLIFTAAVPHHPLLIPAIGKENTKLFPATLGSFKKLRKKLLSFSLDTLIVVSPHAPVLENALGINLSSGLAGTFEQFGDLITASSYRGDVELAYQIKESLETKIPVHVYAEKKLDYGTSVPLFHLFNGQSAPDSATAAPRLIPISTSKLGFENHFHFGELLRKKIDNTSKRVGVIASLHLSHTLDKISPAGFSPQGKVFDQKVIRCLRNKDFSSLMHLPLELMQEAEPCGFSSLFVVLGIIEKMNYQTEIYSYETSFGIGHLVVEFTL